jgi:diguanylate cyclase (GGDEF)-like protein/putative nucleotidyltransferase with HDIG domain
MHRSVRSALAGLRLEAHLNAGDEGRPRGGWLAPPSTSTRLRSLGWFYLGGAAFSLLMLIAPHPSTFKVPDLLALPAGAAAVGIFLLANDKRLPGAALDLAAAFGVLMASLVLLWTPNGGHQPYAQFYNWVILISFYVLPWRRAAIQIALVGAGYGTYLLQTNAGLEAGVQRWLMMIGTVTVAGVIVALLKHRIERLGRDLVDTIKRDATTGFLNGPGFEELLDRELERAQRSESRLSVIVCDLDHFQKLNEALGRRGADDRIRAVADVLDATKRRIDVVARLSGQVFGVLLPDTDEHGAYVLSDRLRRAIRDHFADDANPITASFGVVSFPKHGSSFEELYGAATQAVYAAKELGRDRSVIYNPEITANLRSMATRGGMQAEEHLAAVLILAETLDMRDTSTARHSETVARYAKLIALELGLPPKDVERIHLAGMLHDIGKIGISDKILQKPGSLNQAEWEEMRKHPELGSRILDGANLQDISFWVRAHHERPDGRGYPLGLGDEKIPLEAKILAVADSYEAMTGDRVYRPGMCHEDARTELLRCCGSQFDRDVVHAFTHALERDQAFALSAETVPLT